ncbi:MAG: aldehyde ferredoxin oxidoreductase N-terminal domain-containing protein [Candidatus Bathyarchaeia archaeon]
MTPGGYHGRLLRIDLTSSEATVEPLEAEVLFNYIGGRGLAVKILYDELGLVDGDRLYIEVLGRGVARLVVVRRSDAAERILERLDNPPNLGKLRGRITREEIYEDTA